MAVFPRPSSPAAAWRDLRAFLRTRERHQLVFAALAVAMPALIITGFYIDSHVEPPPPEMHFIPSWPADRSDAEIIAQQKIDDAAKKKAQEERQAAFKRLQDRFGIE